MSKSRKLRANLNARNKATQEGADKLKSDIKSGVKKVAKGVSDGVKKVGKFARDVNNTMNEVARIPYYGTQVYKAATKTARAVKGIFNHPSWYEYNGELSIPAHNIMRPFTPTSLKKALHQYGNGQYNVTGAVTHVIQVGVKYNDMSNDESFKLATIEAFRKIRLDLKSNLIYTQKTYDNYVNMACSIFTKAKALEKAFGTFNMTRPDIPEFSRATQTVPANMYESGVLSPIQIACLSDAEYANNLNKLKKLQSLIKMISIPKKLSEYLSWWVGSMFIDQTAPNPQVYTTMLRECPIYRTNISTNSLDTLGYWDIATGDVQTVIDEAMDLLANYGVLNADIAKTGRYGLCDIVLPENYQMVFLNDKEFFSILVNSYGTANNGRVSQIFDPNYVRVDALEELSDANYVGMSNALATWANRHVLVSIVNQSCYLQVDSTFDLPTGINVVNKTGSIVTATQESDGVWLQTTGVSKCDMNIKVNASATTITHDASIDSRIADASTSTSVTIKFKAGSIFGCLTNNNAILGNFSIIAKDMSGANMLVCTKTSKLLLVNATTYATVDTLTSVNANLVLDTLGGFYVLSADTNYTSAPHAADYGKLFGPNGRWYNSYIPSGDTVATFSFTSTANSYTVASDNEEFTPLFVDLVDYHLPIIKRRYVYINSPNGNIEFNYRDTLIKECYKPMLFNLADIDTVLYWMYCGLFSMD